MSFGYKQRDLENRYHCDYGPAICRSVTGQLSFHKEWWQHGKRHRTDGPAIEYADGLQQWYYEDKFINCQSQIEFEKYIKNRAFW